MAKLGTTDILTILDSIAQQALNSNATIVGSAGYNNNRATLLATADIEILGALGTAFNSDPSVSFIAAYAARLASLKSHLTNIGTVLLAADKRVHRYLNELLNWGLPPQVIMPPPYLGVGGATPKLANFVVSGAGAGTFTDGAAIDLTKYGKAWLQIKTTHAIGTGTLSATIIGKKIDNSAQSKTIAIPNSTLINVAIPIGTPGVDADHYSDVTNITITGGVALDAFDIESVTERAIAL